MSQDHLEVWFSAVRSRGGNNNNPNCEQFKATFKRLLVHHEIRTTDKENANCEDNNINILDVTCPSSKKNLAISYQMTDEVLDALCADEIIQPEEDITLDSVDEDIVGYIAGFIIKKLEDKKKMVLTRFKDLENQSHFSDLIDLKNRGRLITPAATIINVCKEVEKQVQFHEKDLINPVKFPVIENEILAVVEDSMDDSQELWDTHLLELVVKSYIRVKIRYLCRRISEVDKNIRHSSTKNVIFNNQ
jgi:hypothetical protein